MELKTDYLIIGAGPAGLQLGYYLEKAGRDYLILERGNEPGTFFKKFPRHRKLISINKVYTGYEEPERSMRWDWNSLLSQEYAPLFKEYSERYFPPADELVRYLKDFVSQHRIKVRTGTEVVRVRKGELFRVEDKAGNVYLSKRLIIATGVSRPHVPDILGIELAEQYTEVSVDPDEFKNKRVLILGKGNSAFETADNLVETAAIIHVASPNPVKLAWHTRFVGHLRAVNNNLLDTYHLKAQNALLDATVLEMVRVDNGRIRVTFAYTHAGGEVESIEYDRVIACTGFRVDASLFDESCRPELIINNRFPHQTSAFESVNVKDMYFAGTIMQGRDYRKTNSGFIHGFRYNVATLAKILEERYEGKPLPSSPVEPTASGLAHELIRRLNLTSALWQQFNFLCDAIVVPTDGSPARYYDCLPTDYVHDSELGKNEHYYVITLTFGDYGETDPFALDRNSNPERGELSLFLHPLVRRYNRGKLVSEHHIYENLFGEWEHEKAHVAPLHRYLMAQLGDASMPRSSSSAA